MERSSTFLWFSCPPSVAETLQQNLKTLISKSMEAKLGLYRSDCDALIAHEKHKDKIFKLKRRWLIGIPLSRSEKKKFHKYWFLPESLLRDDDIFYENVKEYVEEAYGARSARREDHIVQDSKLLFDRTKMKRMLVSRLDALTNKGLYLIAMLLTGGLAPFETTRKKMKMVIKESGVLRDQNKKDCLTDSFMLLYQLLNSPHSFQESCMAWVNPTFESHYSTCTKILEGLEDLPSEALLAMRRKLRGVPPTIPHLQKKKQGHSRDSLIHYIKKTSEKMLSELGEGDELQAPLAKALAVAGLSLKITTGCLNSSITDFNQFSPEIKDLHNEISKAIWLLRRKKLRLPEVKALQVLLDPKANVPNGSLRTAMNKLFTEYLFESSEFHNIPKPLSEALAIINRSSCKTRRGCYLKEQIDEEVECILGLSSELKQMVWDIYPDQEFDGNFTDAYVEELEETDDGDGDEDGNDFVFDYHNGAGCGDDCQHMEHRKLQSTRSYSIDMEYQEESCADFIPVDSTPLGSNPEMSCGLSLFHERSNHYDMHNLGVNQFEVQRTDKLGTSNINGNGFSLHHSPNESSNSHYTRRNVPEKHTATDTGNCLDVPPANFCFKGAKFVSHEQQSSNNLYLGIQEVCDETSMVAYNLIGYIMEGLVQKEGLNLDWDDISYLRSDKSVEENQDSRKISYEQNATGSDIVEVVKQIVPYLPQSENKKLKEVMGI